MTARQFRKAIEAGVFGERHVELLGGIPFVMSENPPHILASIRLFAGLSALAVVAAMGRQQGAPFGARPMVAAPGRRCAPRALIQPTDRDGPGADDVALLVEIADSSYARDSGVKLRRYAGSRIPVYWIVDLNRRLVEVRTLPTGNGKQADYAQCDVYQESDQRPCRRWTDKLSDQSPSPRSCPERAQQISPGHRPGFPRHRPGFPRHRPGFPRHRPAGPPAPFSA